jgi:hypothetical protein
MTYILNTIDAWWGIHPQLMELLFFCIALLTSVFPDGSRRLLVAPMRFSVHGALRLFQRKARRELEVIRRLEGSAFKLVAYIGYYCLHSMFWSLVTSGAIYFGLNAFSYWQTGHQSVLPFNVLFLGTLIGKAIKLYFFLGDLLRPEEEMVKELETIAAGERIK